MTTTTRGNIVTPDDTTPNDFALALGNLAQATMDAVYQEGLQASRPAASATNKGLLFRVTDTNTAGGWFASDGTQWVRLTASPWVDWTPITVTVTNGSGAVASGVSYSSSSRFAQYRLLPNGLLEFHLEEVVVLSGIQKFVGLFYSAPIPSARFTLVSVDAMDDIGRSFVGDTSSFGNVVSVFPNGGYAASNWQFNSGSVYMGQWYIDGLSRNLRIAGTYPV